MSANENLLYPLSEFYDRWGLTLPRAEEIEGGEMPEEYRSLLVHDRDMTPTLEAAYGGRAHLHTKDRVLRSHVLSRQVVLVLEDDETVIELGAIKIYLNRFPLDARSLIHECLVPLGTILKTYSIAHDTRPSCFFQVEADNLIRGRLGVNDAGLLYGRRAVLRDRSKQALARVIEILPPSKGISTKEVRNG